MQCRLVNKRPVFFLREEWAGKAKSSHGVFSLEKHERLFEVWWRSRLTYVWVGFAGSYPSGYWPSSLWTHSQQYCAFLIATWLLSTIGNVYPSTIVNNSAFVAGCVCIIVYLWKMAWINGLFIFTNILLFVQSSNSHFKQFSVHLLAQSGVRYDVFFLLSK